MKMVSSLFPGSVNIDDTSVTSFVIENKALYMRVLRDIYCQSVGEKGDIVFSENDKIIKLSDKIELISDFITLTLENKKTGSRIAKILESELMKPERYTVVMQILSDIERCIDEAAGLFPFNLEYEGLDIAHLVKMVGPRITDDSVTAMERVLNYLSIMTELFGERLFVLVGMREFFSDEDMQQFVDMCLLHKYHILLMESHESAILNGEKRVLLDNDICLI